MHVEKESANGTDAELYSAGCYSASGDTLSSYAATELAMENKT
jgi:hypothetical protein